MKNNLFLFLSCLLSAVVLTGCASPSDYLQQSVEPVAENHSVQETPADIQPETFPTEQDDNNNIIILDETVENSGHDGFICLPDDQEYAELYSDTEQSSVIARMYHAESLTVYDMQGDLASVNYQNLNGYVALDYISFSKPPEKSAPEPETTSPPETQPPQTQPPATTPPVNQITNNNTTNNYNLVLIDYDGFEYANPVHLSNYTEVNRNAWCSTTSAYIYAQPDSSSAKREANMLYYGDSLTVLGSAGNYYYIATDSGSGYDLHGYVKQSYITYGQSPAPPEPAYATRGCVNVGSANVRSSPDKSTDNNVMFVLYNGAEFDVLSYDGYWYKINYNGTICYISHKMVDVW